MIEPIWAFIGLLVGDLVIAWVIKKSGLQNAFAIITVISFVLPLMYSVWEWQAGIQSGKYGITDTDERILWVVMYGLGFAFSGGIVGYFLGGRGSNNSGFTVS